MKIDQSLFANEEYIKLRGDWEFYWNQLLMPGEIDSAGKMTGYIDVPGKWNEYRMEGEGIPGKGFATYRLHIDLNDELHDYAIKFQGIGTSARVFLNDSVIYESGNPGTDKTTTVPWYGNGLINVPVWKKSNELVVQVSNYMVKDAGIEDVYFGNNIVLEGLKDWWARWDFFLFGSILIMAIYHLGIYIIRRSNKSAFYFSLFCVLLAIRILVTGDKILLDHVSINWVWMIRIEYLTFYAAAPFFILFTRSIFPNAFSKLFARIFVAISAFLSILVLVAPVPVFTQTLLFFQILTGVGGLYITYVSLSAIGRKKTEALIFLLGWLLLFISVINDILYFNEVLHFSGKLSSVGLFMFIIFQAYLMATQFSKAIFQSEKLAKKLNYTNKNLSRIVEFRTSELEKQKEDLFYQKMEIEEKNTDITDSLNYASRIQSAVLPTDESFSDCFHDFFIHYVPKDIVSGDFYWIKRIRSKIIVAAADCTGHGVPGAFMSLLGIAFLNEIVNMFAYRNIEGNEILPDRILNELRKRIKSALRQTGEIDETFDGIDMALCIMDYAENTLQYAGANNAMYIVSLNEKTLSVSRDLIEKKRVIVDEGEHSRIYEVKANRMPIGAYLSEKPFDYYEFNLDEADYVYLFSDGYPDQIGGETETKFRLKRFKQMILENAHKKMDEQYKVVIETMEEWKSESIGQIDDITVIGIKLHADREERSFGFF